MKNFILGSAITLLLSYCIGSTILIVKGCGIRV